MQRLLTIFLTLLLTLLTASASPSSPIGEGWGSAASLSMEKGWGGASYIIAINDGDTVPSISDEELLRNGIAVSFKVNSTQFAHDDPGFIRLRHALLNIPEGFRFCRLLVLRGSASPEGPAENNKRLAHRRARALTDSLKKYVDLPDSTVEERFVNEDYAGLYSFVKASSMSYRQEVMATIEQSADDAEIKRKLQGLDNGKAWKILLRDFFPKLRATRVIMVISRNPKEIRKPIVVPPLVKKQPLPEATTDTVEAPKPVYNERSVFKPWLSVKSNLLYDAAMTPNVEIERWFGKNARWSVMAEWNFPWWQWHNKERVYEVNMGSMELRLWLGDRSKRWPLSHKEVDEYHPLLGHFLGLYAAGGYYDLEWDYKGEQGDIYSVGLTYGYATRLSRHWNMEFSLSVGYLYSPYTHYGADNGDDILFAKYRKHLNYIGPTKLKVSLVYLLGRTKKK